MSSPHPATAPDWPSRLGPDALVYLVGAGGCGMSALAHLLIDWGCRVAGSDLALNEETEALTARGMQVQAGHDPAGLAALRPDLLVYSSAVGASNPELAAAGRLQVPCVRRAELLASFVHHHCGIGVAGMHGKTTTASLLAFALRALGSACSHAIGAKVPQLERHGLLHPAAVGNETGTRPYFVVEADESDGSLCCYAPEHAILLNIDREHLDHFGDFAGVRREFLAFSQQVRGELVYCADDPGLCDLLRGKPRWVSYGFDPKADFQIVDAVPNSLSGGSCFCLRHQSNGVAEVHLSLRGEQNISNAAAVATLLLRLGFSAAQFQPVLTAFRGAARRQEELAAGPEHRVFDDYGHHPCEIRATLQALKPLARRRFLVAFQPHRYTRTQALLSEFAHCFAGADCLWITDVYAASERPIPGVDGGLLVAKVSGNVPNVRHCPKVETLPDVVLQEARPGDLVLFIGAGDITVAAHQFAGLLRSGSSVSREVSVSALAARLSPSAVVRAREPLARRTTFRVGGSADLYVEPDTEADLVTLLAHCREHGLRYLLLGRGSNLLIRDGGVRGLVICLARPTFSTIQVDGQTVHSGAGAKLKALAQEARRAGLSGLEFLEGIPGSVGGALRMNAGAMGSSIFDRVLSLRCIDGTGQLGQLDRNDIPVGYRGCPFLEDKVVLSVVLRGDPAPMPEIESRMSAFASRRWSSQPAAPSAGCIFKNPAMIPAGKLIDELGLKGARVGGAVVSEVHGNFIVNDGGATATDILRLIELVRTRARQERGVELETEVRIVGED